MKKKYKKQMKHFLIIVGIIVVLILGYFLILSEKKITDEPYSFIYYTLVTSDDIRDCNPDNCLIEYEDGGRAEVGVHFNEEVTQICFIYSKYIISDVEPFYNLYSKGIDVPERIQQSKDSKEDVQCYEFESPRTSTSIRLYFQLNPDLYYLGDNELKIEVIK